MDIQHISTNKFIVGLSRKDMEQLDITYDMMDYSNIETRRVIWTILDTVRRKTGEDVDPSGNLMIEAAPDSAGGCFLMFTVPVSDKNIGTVISKTNPSQLFEFDNIDSFLDVLKIIQPNRSDGRFFTDGKKYRAELSGEKAAVFRRILEEYGRFVGKDSLVCAATHEHWKELNILSSQS